MWTWLIVSARYALASSVFIPWVAPSALGRNWHSHSTNRQSAIANLRVPDGFQVMKSWHPNDRNCCWQGATVNAFGDLIGCTYLQRVRQLWQHPRDVRSWTHGTTTNFIGRCVRAKSKNLALPATKKTAHMEGAALRPMRSTAAGMRLTRSVLTLTREPTFVSCQNICYRKVRNVRVRGVPEMAICLVFTPDDPEIYTLNPSAWLILQLCDGRSETEIAHAYLAAVEPALSPEEVDLRGSRGH